MSDWATIKNILTQDDIATMGLRPAQDQAIWTLRLATGFTAMRNALISLGYDWEYVGGVKNTGGISDRERQAIARAESAEQELVNRSARHVEQAAELMETCDGYRARAEAAERELAEALRHARGESVAEAGNVSDLLWEISMLHHAAGAEAGHANELRARLAQSEAEVARLRGELARALAWLEGGDEDENPSEYFALLAHLQGALSAARPKGDDDGGE